MLALARGRLGNDPAITFSLADYTAEPLPANSDAIVSSLSIHHLEDERKHALSAAHPHRVTTRRPLH